MNYLIAITIAIIVGGLVSIQNSLNANLGKYVGGIGAALVSFLVGTFLLLIFYLIFGESGLKNATKVPYYLFIGGIFGAIFVFSLIKLVPAIGVGASTAGVIAGQLLVAVVIDSFGLFGVPPHKFNLARLLGSLFLLIGVKLMAK